MTELETAIKIAFEATVGQKDHDGGEEILHPLSVMLKGETYQEKIVGVLHDVVEDNDEWTFERLLDEGISEKCVDRCHRIGQKDNLTIYTLMCKDTIDERIHEIVEQKGEMANAIVDGKVTMNNKELLIMN